MDIDVADQIQKRMAELPADVLAAIQSADLGKRIQEIGLKNQLHIDQMQDLENATLLVMLGFSNPDTFGARLAGDLHIPSDKGQALAADVNAQIFLTIRESMKQFAVRKLAPIVQTPTPSPAAIPTPTVTPPAPPKPSVPQVVDMHAADVMLREKTVSLPVATTPRQPTSQKVEPPKPAAYTADPYREPIEP